MKNHLVWLLLFLACSISSLGFEAIADSAGTVTEQSPTKIAEASTGFSELGAREDSLDVRAYDFAERIFREAKVVQYQHLHEPAKEQVQEKNGQLVCRNDCSGFISYVLDSVAPKHYRPIRERQPERGYPQAKTFAKFFHELSSDTPRDGWIGVPSYKDLRRGDIIAWEKPPSGNSHKGNSGHVMMVRDHPGNLERLLIDGRSLVLVSVPVLDSSSVYHFPPEELPPSAEQSHRDGVGKGDVKLVLDEQGKPVGYWEGTYWGEGQKEIRKPAFSEMIGFGRMVPNR